MFHFFSNKCPLNLFFNLSLAVLGLCCCVGIFSLLEASRSYSPLAVLGLLVVAASPDAQHRLQVLRLPQLWLTGSRARTQELWCMGLVAPRHVGSSRSRDHPMSPALAGRFFTTESPRKPLNLFFF